MSERILVLGCGPAAAMAALEFSRMGYAVQVIGKLRGYPVTEGISERVFQALKMRGLANEISEPVPRTAIWNGETRTVNTERLVYRPDFDQALMNRLVSEGIQVLDEQVDEVDTENLAVKLRSGGLCTADVVVEARGRGAGFEGKGRTRGPETVSLACRWQSQAGAPATLAVSQPDGWLWLARHADGGLFVQVTRHSDDLGIKRSDIPDLLKAEILKLSAETGIDMGQGEQLAQGLARSSTAILVDDIVKPGYIRIGDAAMAVDPLSGNGIFQSLSSALTAVPVVNTLLKRPGDSELALQFYRDRVAHLFTRFARTGRDFYASETEWRDEYFWQQRQAWPDTEPSHYEDDVVTGRALRPVINRGFIESKEVILTRNQPMGIWQVDGVQVGKRSEQS